jgi:catechol 2,3-dioxygenase-like lactoylglutathione lyase family enzyme
MEAAMYTIGNAQVWVHDQDEALEFYTKKLGMEVRSDVTIPEMGDFRWLAVGPPGQEDFGIVLMAIPGPPMFDTETVEQIRSLMAKGVSGGVFLVTDDCQKAFEELSSRGVEFQEPPEKRPYGIDAGFRDPSGNSFRLTQVTAME